MKIINSYKYTSYVNDPLDLTVRNSNFSVPYHISFKISFTVLLSRKVLFCVLIASSIYPWFNNSRPAWLIYSPNSFSSSFSESFPWSCTFFSFLFLEISFFFLSASLIQLVIRIALCVNALQKVKNVHIQYVLDEF